MALTYSLNFEFGVTPIVHRTQIPRGSVVNVLMYKLHEDTDIQCIWHKEKLTHIFKLKFNQKLDPIKANV